MARLKFSQKKIFNIETMEYRYARPLKDRIKLLASGSLLMIPVVNLLFLKMFSDIKKRG